MKQLLFFGAMVLLLLFSTPGLKAQQNFLTGYIITNDGDTLHGFVDYRSENRNALMCSYKKNFKDKPVKYKPGEIRAYRFEEGPYYISKVVRFGEHEKTYFLEYLVEGISNLYFLKKGTYRYFYIETQDGELVQLSNETKIMEKDNLGTSQKEMYKYQTKRHVGILKYVFQDSKELYPEIEKVVLDPYYLTELTVAYHNNVCNDEKCLNYKRKIPALKGNYGFYGGMNALSPDYKESSYTVFTHDHKIIPTFETYTAPALGAYVDFHFQRMMNTLSFQASMEVSKYKGTWEENAEEVVGTYYNKIEFDQVVLQTSYSLKYTLTRKLVSPFIKTGFSSWSARGKNYRTFTSNYDHIDDEENEFSTEIGSREILYGIGCYIRIKTKNCLFAEFIQQSHYAAIRLGYEF